jgi:hypothetical protein
MMMKHRGVFDFVVGDGGRGRRLRHRPRLPPCTVSSRQLAAPHHASESAYLQRSVGIKAIAGLTVTTMLSTSSHENCQKRGKTEFENL